MKKLLPILFAIIAQAAHGQTASSEAFILQYKGYSVGQYHISITNKQACNVSLQLNWNSRNSDSVLFIPAQTTISVDITDIYDGSNIKIRTIDCCTPGCNSGYISVTTSITLGINSNNIYYRRPLQVQAPEKTRIYTIEGKLIKELLTINPYSYIKQLPKGIYIVKNLSSNKKVFVHD